MRDGADKKVIVAEEQKILRDALTRLLKEIEGLEAVGEAEDEGGVVEAVERLRPDVVIMGLSATEISGLSATREIKKRFPETKILILTVYDSEEQIRAAFKAGADGYCLKDSGLEEFSIAIKAVLAGKVYFTPAISDKVLEGYLRPDKPSKLDVLTKREKEILRLLGEGRRNIDIAQLLSISDKTVAKHKGNIMRKLGSDLNAIAVRNLICQSANSFSH